MRSRIDASPRVRRLRADHQLMTELKGRSDMIDFEIIDQVTGMPPEKYVVTFKCKSIVGIDKAGKPKFGRRHRVEVYLHNEYPRRWPGLKWLTPIWHPNINHVNGSVCIDAAWWTAARSLDRLVIMMGEMAQYKNYHDDPDKPPFPWDREAADWSRKYRKSHPDIFPVDKRELLRPERIKLSKAAQSSTSKKRAKIKLK